MADPFTIRIFVPDGDPEGLRIIDRMNWTGLGIVFPREDWPEIKQRSDFSRPGVYILIGYVTDDDLPTLYIGQGDVVRARLESHVQNKDFWSKAVVFVSSASSGGLNRAHATWLEHALINRAVTADRSHLENGTEPQAPQLSEAEKADTQAFLREMLQILPLVGLNAFETPKAVAEPKSKSVDAAASKVIVGEIDTIVVPAQKDGFEQVFINDNAWWAIRISGGMLSKIKYIAAYQSQPISAITHVAPVARIEPYGDSGKYKLIFSEPAKPIGPIPFADAPSGFMQGPRYTT
ncbi:MAG: GIY-YIG nuclease family protein, partial [Pseudolabrys sp.]